MSMKFTPAWSISMSASSGPGAGTATSRSTHTSGVPNLSIAIARMPALFHAFPTRTFDPGKGAQYGRSAQRRRQRCVAFVIGSQEALAIGTRLFHSPGERDTVMAQLLYAQTERIQHAPQLSVSANPRFHVAKRHVRAKEPFEVMRFGGRSELVVAIAEQLQVRVLRVGDDQLGDQSVERGAHQVELLDFGSRPAPNARPAA